MLIPQIESLIVGEINYIANLANIAAALKETFQWLWTGFYMVQDNELVLGPFQGPVACTRIQHGKGVCGTSWKNNQSLLVPDVNLFPGHIVCSSLSVSEIVIPIRNIQNDVIGVLDIDSEHFDTLDETDVFYLEKIAALITTYIQFPQQ